MSDSEIVITSPVSTELPKPTTPDDLLSMYEEESQLSEEIEPSNEPKLLEVSTETTPELAQEKSILSESGVIKAKDGDIEIKIPEMAKFAVEVNGKTVEVTQKDAVQAFVRQEEFNRSMDSRLAKASNKERQVDSAFNNLLGIATKIKTLSEKGDLLAVNRELAKVAANGTELDIVGWERKFFEQNKEFFKAYSSLSPEQIDRFFLEREAQLSKEQLKNIREKEVQKTELSRLEAKVVELQTSYQIDNKEFWETYEVMIKDLVGPGRDFATDKDIQPEDVVEQTLLIRRYNEIYKAANKLGLNNEDIIDELASMTSGRNDYTAEDFEEIIKRSGVLDNIAPKSTVENLNRKAQKSGAKPKSASSTKRETKQEGLSKEDLDFLYRNQPKQYKPIRFR